MLEMKGCAQGGQRRLCREQLQRALYACDALVSFLCSFLAFNAECLGGASHPRRALTRGKSGLQSQLVGNIQFKPCLTLLSFHKVLLSRIHKNEIRLVDLDLISSALQLKRFSVNSLTTCTVPCAWIWP